tara:strand:- start:77 stop:514 length:438 start_codon:yes stop_codon:yes gene_type:complete
MIKHKILKQAVLNNIMTNGNKQTSEKIFVKTVKVIQKNKRKKNFETILKTSLINSAPLIYIKQVKRKRKRATEFPFLLNSKLKMFYAMKFLISNSKKTATGKFYKSFSKELLNSSGKISLSFKRKIDLHEDGFAKRKFANYRWFK